MRADHWLKRSTQKLVQAGIATARLDALVLLEDISGQDRAWLLAHPETEITADQVELLQKLLSRRSQHEPLAYVRGRSEFYGREFVISSAVLQPRPESEAIIDVLKKLPTLPARPAIADVGTGSGALGITAKLELPSAQVELLDIDADALAVAQINVDKFTLTISVLHSDLLENSLLRSDVLLCNLPYVPDGFVINTAAGHEPRRAIFGGPDGLDIYRQLFRQINNLKNKPLYILTEALPPAHQDLQTIARQAGYAAQQSVDFVQQFGLV